MQIQSIMTNKEYRVLSLKNNVGKINTQNSNLYRALATNLNEKGKKGFTYEDKNNRHINVMAGGTYQTEDIREDLKIKGLQIEDAVNILKPEKIETNDGIKINKELPLFMLTFNSKKPEMCSKLKPFSTGGLK